VGAVDQVCGFSAAPLSQFLPAAPALNTERTGPQLIGQMEANNPGASLCFPKRRRPGRGRAEGAPFRPTLKKTLAAYGHLTGGGKPYTATAVQKMLRGVRSKIES
jgi:hypothetical protein